jgi:hypothetical protein
VVKTAADMSSAMFKLIDWWPNMDPNNVHKQQERAIVLKGCQHSSRSTGTRR